MIQFRPKGSVGSLYWNWRDDGLCFPRSGGYGWVHGVGVVCVEEGREPRFRWMPVALAFAFPDELV